MIKITDEMYCDLSREYLQLNEKATRLVKIIESSHWAVLSGKGVILGSYELLDAIKELNKTLERDKDLKDVSKQKEE